MFLIVYASIFENLNTDVEHFVNPQTIINFEACIFNQLYYKEKECNTCKIRYL